MKNTKTPKITSKSSISREQTTDTSPPVITTRTEMINSMERAIAGLFNELSDRISYIESKLAEQENKNTDISPPVITTSRDKGYGVTWLLLGLVVGYIFYTIFTK